MGLISSCDHRHNNGLSHGYRFHYSHDDLITSDADDLLCKARNIDMLSLSPYADMQDAINHGLSFAQYFARGTVPLPQVKLFQAAWELLRATATERNGRPGHANDMPDGDPNDVIVDPETGEVFMPDDFEEVLL